MDKKTGGCAFPLYWVEIETRGDPAYVGPTKVHWNRQGMTLRDYFASKALINYIDFTPGCDMARVAKVCYKMADAMLKEREKEMEALPDE